MPTDIYSLQWKNRKLFSNELFHFIGIAVWADPLASHASYDVDVASIVLKPLLRPAPWHLLLVLLSFDLGSLALDLTGPGERSVHFTHNYCKLLLQNNLCNERAKEGKTAA